MDHRVHPMARAFGEQADAYLRGRAPYPARAVDELCAMLGVRAGAHVLDVAAGPGLLTVPLRDRGLRMLAVEPDPGMRRAFARHVDGVEVRDGTAEDLPVPDAAVDAVVVGQGFHWFDRPAALREFARVLRPTGAVGLVWNVRDQSDPVQRAVSALLEPHRGGAPAHRSERWRDVFDDGTADTLGFTPLTSWSMRWRHRLSADELADRAASVSFVAALDVDTRARLLDDVRALVGPTGEVALAYETTVHVTRRTHG